MAVDNGKPFVVGPKLIIGETVKFFPAGTYEHHGHLIERKFSLIQVYTDPGGTQTLKADAIRFKDPRKAKK